MVEAEEQKLKAREDAIHEQEQQHEKLHKHQSKELQHNEKGAKKAT